MEKLRPTTPEERERWKRETPLLDPEDSLRLIADIERLLGTYRDLDWCYICDRPKGDCGCVENGGNY